MSFNSFKDWLDEALDDYSASEILFKGRKYSKVCFYSQQAAELALKYAYEVIRYVQEQIK